MRTARLGLSKLLIALCMVTFFASILPTQALAYTLHVTNNYPHKLYVASLEWSDSAGDWRTHGWWAVEPQSVRHINFNDSTAKINVYLYSYTSEASFGGEGYPRSVARIVVNDRFDYLGPDAAPAGKNRRKVYFANYEISNGHVEYTP